MKILEQILLSCWLMGILMIQFHERTHSFIKKWDHFGLCPSFHLFSPKPFLAIYLIRYKITTIKQNEEITMEDQLNYWDKPDLIDANQKIIKCINNLCKNSITTPALINTSFALLLNHVKNDARKKSHTGKIQFFILTDNFGEKSLKFSSKVYDL